MYLNYTVLNLSLTWNMGSRLWMRLYFCSWTMMLCCMYKLLWQMPVKLREWWLCFKKWAKATDKSCKKVDGDIYTSWLYFTWCGLRWVLLNPHSLLHWTQPTLHQPTLHPGMVKPTGLPSGPAFDSLTKHCDLTNADSYSNNTGS